MAPNQRTPPSVSALVRTFGSRAAPLVAPEEWRQDDESDGGEPADPVAGHP